MASLYSTVISGTQYYVRAVNALNAKIRFYKNVGYYPSRVNKEENNYIPDNKNRNKEYDTWANTPDIKARKEYYPSMAEKEKVITSADNILLLLG